MQELVKSLRDDTALLLSRAEAITDHSRKVAREARGRYCKAYQRQLSDNAIHLNSVSVDLAAVISKLDAINDEG